MVVTRPPAPGARRLPAYLRPALLLAVLLGGMTGTFVRAQLSAALPPSPGDWPWVTFAINVSGAFLLGLLLHTLALTGPDEGVRRSVRLGVGTGVLGGYTTYSTFAVESVTLGETGHLATALGYDAASVALGVLAAGSGFLIAQALPRPGRPGRPDHPAHRQRAVP